jgi:[glutamine synthetase] adenylyltransferase / [glutamine synthetase]-adenylyl-L-tyrosine phosphorylase
VIVELILATKWRSSMAEEIRTLRNRMQQSATVGNLKRGEGGTSDVEFISQTLTLKHASNSPEIITTGTTASLERLASAGYLSEENALTLIANYRTLRWVEANLRLMNTPARHELPEDALSMRNLAFLMNEHDEKMILARCRHACQSNRKIFDSIFDELAMS